jgi:nitroreductase
MMESIRPDYPIHDLIANRWSPYIFEPRAIEQDKLLSCLEAARWAPSSYNEQPWFFLLGKRDNADEFSHMVGCLVEGNQIWAKNAGALLLTAVATAFQRNGKPNRAAEHDLGLATGNLCLQATALGLSVHQMIGIEPAKVRQTYGIPETHVPMTAIAIGYAADPSKGDPQLAERDRSRRGRKPIGDFVFSGTWGKSVIQ